MKLNTKKTTLLVGFVIFVVIVAAYFAGLFSVSKATSTNSDLTITETEDGYAHHKPMDPWVYGQMEHFNLIPYEEEQEQTENVVPQNNSSMDEVPPAEYPINEEIAPEEYSKTEDSGEVTPSDESGCGISAHLEVVNSEYDNETGTATYTCFDYFTNTQFTVVLNYDKGIEAIY